MEWHPVSYSGIIHPVVSVILSILVAIQIQLFLICKNGSANSPLLHYTLLHRTSYETIHLQHTLPPGNFAQLYICMGSNTAILWLHIQTILAHQFPAITVLKIFVKMQTIMLQCYVMFY